MRTIYCSGRLGGVCQGGCLPRRVCLPRDVSALKECLPRGSVCPGGVSAQGVSEQGVCLPRGMSAQGECLPRVYVCPGVCAQECVYPGGMSAHVGVSAQGGVCLGCMSAQGCLPRGVCTQGMFAHGGVHLPL